VVSINKKRELEGKIIRSHEVLYELSMLFRPFGLLLNKNFTAVNENTIIKGSSITINRAATLPENQI